MEGWINTKDELPEIGEKTIIKTIDLTMVNPWMCSVIVSCFDSCQVYGNDIVPYCWRGPGPFRFFGHEVTHWMRLPPRT
jgi:hypothetical protein